MAGEPRDRSGKPEFDFRKLGLEILAEGEWAYDPLAEVWRPLGRIEPGLERGELSDGELGELLDHGDPLPAWLMPAAVAAELRRARPPRSARGVVVFCTGLSGSGKSTLARDLRDALLERGDRTVSLLDGDLVRRLLSAGLTFSREDRDLNIARIGYVAAEVARHGGIAICAPIAPYAAARAGVRRMVSEVGDFVLVHVSTPLEVCEARDRKGLYAQARAGRDRLVHRDLRPLRGAGRRGPRDRHVGRLQARRGRGGARPADPRRLARPEPAGPAVRPALRLGEAEDGLFRVRRHHVLGVGVASCPRPHPRGRCPHRGAG